MHKNNVQPQGKAWYNLVITMATLPQLVLKGTILRITMALVSNLYNLVTQLCTHFFDIINGVGGGFIPIMNSPNNKDNKREYILL